MGCGVCDKACLLDCAIERVLRAEIQMSVISQRTVGDKAVSSKPVMTFDNALTLSHRWI